MYTIGSLQYQSNSLERPSTRHGIPSDALKTFKSQAWPLVQTPKYQCDYRVRSLSRDDLDESVMDAPIGPDDSFSGNALPPAVTSSDQNTILQTPYRPGRRAPSPYTPTKHCDEALDSYFSPSSASSSDISLVYHV